ncbi:MAG: hypothetical protein U0003_02470 [Vampirovibrionales bacterium]
MTQTNVGFKSKHLAISLEPTIRFGRLQDSPIALKHTYIMEDLHFNNHQHTDGLGLKMGVKTSRPLVLKEFRQIASEYDDVVKNNSKHVEFNLILNGDIFDLLESWPASIDPADPSTHLKTVFQVLDEIEESHPEVMAALKELLQRDKVRIHYVLGNHERWLKNPQAQAYLKKKLGLESGDPRLEFTRQYYDPDFKLLCIHGDQFDPFCKPPADGLLNTSEKLDIKVIKKLLDTLPHTLEKMGYPNNVVEKVHEVVGDVEYVRPVQQMFAFLFNELTLLEKNLKKEKEKNSKLPSILSVVRDQSVKLIQEAFPEKEGMKWLSRWGIKHTLTHSYTQTILSWLLSKNIKLVRDDKNQLKHAKQFLENFKHPVQLMVLGHTHKPLQEHIQYRHQGVEKSCKVLNIGSYKKTIFYPEGEEIYPSGMLRLAWDNETFEDVTVNFYQSQQWRVPSAKRHLSFA